MYVDTSSVRRGDRVYTRHLLRESFRDAGKVKHRTIANLSQCSPAEVEAIRLALTHKDSLTELGTVNETVLLRQGAAVGAVEFGAGRSSSSVGAVRRAPDMGSAGEPG